MKLSEAIRQGCKIARKKTTGKLFSWNKNNKLEAACILGAGILGSCTNIKLKFGGPNDEAWETFKAKYPVLYHQFKNPKDEIQEQLVDILVHLNDDWDMERYQIVRWLERQGL